MVFETLITFLTIENNNLNIHRDTWIKSDRDSIHNSCDVYVWSPWSRRWDMWVPGQWSLVYDHNTDDMIWLCEFLWTFCISDNWESQFMTIKSDTGNCSSLYCIIYYIILYNSDLWTKYFLSCGSSSPSVGFEAAARSILWDFIGVCPRIAPSVVIAGYT